MKHLHQLNRLSMRSELLEALDWDEDALTEIMKDCDEVLSEIKDVSEAENALQNLQTELIISRDETIAKLAITYYLECLMTPSSKDITS